MNWRSGITALVAVLIVSIAWYFLANRPSPEAPQVKDVSVNLYYYNPENDKDMSGNILCSQRGLVPVARSLPSTEEPLAGAIRLLVRGAITDQEKARGITSAFPLEGFALEKAEIKDGTATLTFADPQNKTSGGACRVSVMLAQINATASQFPGLTALHIEPGELFQP